MSSSGNNSVYFVLVLLLLLVVRRFSRVVRGSKVSMARTAAYSAYYLGFAGLLIAVSVTSGGASATDVVLYALVGAIALYASYVFSDRRMGFWKGADGSIWYKGAIVVYIVYLVGLFTRIAIDLVVVGPQAFTFSIGGPAPTLSTTAIDAGIATDVLLALGCGLLTGRNLRIMKRYRMIMAGKEQITETPPNVPLV